MYKKKLTHLQTADVCRSLSELVRSGFSAADAIHLLSSVEKGPMKTIFSQLGADADTGIPLSQVLLRCGSFSVSTAELIRTGENTGHLEEALLSASRYHSFLHRTSRQLRSSLGYPFLLLGLMLVVAGVLLIQVLPVFDSVYASLGCPMTGIAAGLLHFGQILKAALPGLLLFLFLLSAAVLICRLSEPAKNILARLIRRPLDDRWLFRDFHNARFMQALSMGVRSGMIPEEAVTLASGLMSDSPGAADRCNLCIALLREGAAFPEALLGGELTDTYGAGMLSISARTGTTDQIISQLADRMEETAEQRLQDILRSVEPAIVLISSGLVGLILLSVMIPLVQVLSSLG